MDATHRGARPVAQFVRWWADNRLEGDGEIYAAAREWRGKYLHLANWSRNLEDQVRLRIREQYRRFGVGLTKQYATVYIEDFDLREVAKRPAPESEEVRTASAHQRQMVSPSVFRSALVNACQREGVRVVKVDGAYSTRLCHVCGYGGEWDQAESIMHRCEQCSKIWDQDRNAAINLLQLGLASSAAASTENQPVRPRKWDRVRDRSQKGKEVMENVGVGV
jgi:transposase